MKIGVFDSGMGGTIVAEALRQAFPGNKIVFVNDSKNVPYGLKSPEEIQKLTLRAIQPLIQLRCEVIVIACNTASTSAIMALRQTYPHTFFIGLEPMIKPAAELSRTNIIAVCATPATLASTPYQNLKKTWASATTVIEPDCRTWAELIEKGEPEKINVEALAKHLIDVHCDVIVLGCTHYHWLKERFQKAAPSITILEPTDAIAKRIRFFKSDYRAFTTETN